MITMLEYEFAVRIQFGQGTSCVSTTVYYVAVITFVILSATPTGHFGRMRFIEVSLANIILLHSHQF